MPTQQINRPIWTNCSHRWRYPTTPLLLYYTKQQQQQPPHTHTHFGNRLSQLLRQHRNLPVRFIVPRSPLGQFPLQLRYIRSPGPILALALGRQPPRRGRAALPSVVRGHALLHARAQIVHVHTALERVLGVAFSDGFPRRPGVGETGFERLGLVLECAGGGGAFPEAFLELAVGECGRGVFLGGLEIALVDGVVLAAEQVQFGLESRAGRLRFHGGGSLVGYLNGAVVDASENRVNGRCGTRGGGGGIR